MEDAREICCYFIPLDMLQFYLWIKPDHEKNGYLHLTGFPLP